MILFDDSAPAAGAPAARVPGEPLDQDMQVPLEATPDAQMPLEAFADRGERGKCNWGLDRPPLLRERRGHEV